MKISYKLLILLIGALAMTYSPETKSYSVQQVKDLTKKGNVIVYFYTSGCSYCRYLQPHINRLKSKLGNNVTYLAVNVGSNKRVFYSTFGFSTVPIVMYFKNGVKKSSHGSQNKGMTAQEMAQIVNRIYQTNIVC